MPDVTLMAGWADMDSNAHMRNTAYLDKAVDVRMLFFTKMGFPATEFERLRLGPVVMRDEVEYFLEIRMLERFGSRWNSAACPPTEAGFACGTGSIGTMAGSRPVSRAREGGWTWLSASSRLHRIPLLLRCGACPGRSASRTCPRA